MSRSSKDTREETDEYSWSENVIIMVRKRTDENINKLFETPFSKN